MDQDYLDTALDIFSQLKSKPLRFREEMQNAKSTREIVLIETGEGLRVFR